MTEKSKKRPRFRDGMGEKNRFFLTRAHNPCIILYEIWKRKDDLYDD